MKLKSATTIFGLVVIAFLCSDFLGLFPTLGRNMGLCKSEASSKLVGMHRPDDEPIDSRDNIQWYSRHEELISACMGSRGYKYDDEAAAKNMVKFKQTGAYNSDAAIQLEQYWSHRWIWQ